MNRDDDAETLIRRAAPLDMPAEEFRRLGHALIDDLAAFLESLPRRPVNRDESPGELRGLLPDGGLPKEGSDPRQLIAEATSLLTEHSLFNGHPRFFGYITSSAAPIGALADLLASAVNCNVGGWQLSPMASEIEAQCVRWIAEMLGAPGHGGLLVSGGNMANFVGFLAARRAKAPEGLRRDGLAAGRGRLLVFASGETHTWIDKAADLFGHGHSAIRRIPLDVDLRADLTQLERAIVDERRNGNTPFLLVGNAGTVATGAVDPLPRMAEIARRHDLWFHVDGAYGAFAAMLPDRPDELAALASADSIAVDPHKWLYAPLEAGCALLRDPDALRDAFSYTPPYYHFAADEVEPRINYYEHGFQNSRGFRALKVWLALRQVGRRGYVKMISDDIRLAERLHRRVAEHPQLEACSLGLSIVTFRYRPPGFDDGSPETESYLDRLNERLLHRLNASGEAFLNAVAGGKFLLRACIVNFRTSLEDVEALPEIVVRHARQVDEELRAGNR